MGIMDKIMQRREQTVTPELSDVLLRALLDGETITRQKAMTLPAVSAAVDLISSAVAGLPVQLYRKKDGRQELISDDGRIRLLNTDTQDTLDAYQLKKAMVQDYLLGQGGYAYIRKKRNTVTGLFYVPEECVGVLKNADPIQKSFMLTVNGQQYEPYEFIKLLRNTRDGASGIGLTVEVAKALETAYQTLLYQLTGVRSGGSKRGFLKAERRLGQEEIDVLKRSWARLYANNEENVVVLNNGLQFQEASASSVEMQLNESKRTLTDEINAIFHIYPDFDATFKSAIWPIVRAFESALNRDLLLEREKTDHFFTFDTKELIRADIASRFSAYRTAKETGFLTLNEIRQMENLNTVEGMDVINVGLSAVLYDTNSGTYFVPNTGTTTDPEEQDLPEEQDRAILNLRYPGQPRKHGEYSFGKMADGKKTKYAPSDPVPPIVKKVPPKKYAQLCGIAMTHHSEKQGTGAHFMINDGTTEYECSFKENGGLVIYRKTPIPKRGKRNDQRRRV